MFYNISIELTGDSSESKWNENNKNHTSFILQCSFSTDRNRSNVIGRNCKCSLFVFKDTYIFLQARTGGSVG